MTKAKALIFFLVATLVAVSVGNTHAQDCSISKNGSGSESSCEINASSSDDINQGNDLSVHNDIDISANTGGNSEGGSTGDVNIDLKVNTQGNVNVVGDSKETNGKSAPTPTPTPISPSTSTGPSDEAGPDEGGSDGENGPTTTTSGDGDVLGAETLASTGSSFVLFDELTKTLLSYTSDIYVDGQLSPKYTSRPKRIVISGREVDVAVGEASITNGKWEVADSMANFLDKSSVPGAGGNVVVYAHNRPDLFGNIRNVDLGEVVEIMTEDGEIHRYAVSETKIVSPETVSDVLPTYHEQLTLYTCAGENDAHRFIVKALPLGS